MIASLALHSVLAVSTPQHGRSLSYVRILNYNPGSGVTDHSNIDLDQKALESELKGVLPAGYTNAKAIYTSGAHSKPTAKCTLASGTLGVAVAKKDKISFTTANGDASTGKAYSAYDATATEISFTYPVSLLRVQPVDTQCYVGGLDSTAQSTLGCIAGSAGTDPSSGSSAGTSTITIGTTSYSVTCTNSGKRTLQGFSTKAKAVMYDCPEKSKDYKTGCPYTSYLPYFNYYGVHDYANQIVLAALDGTAVSGFTNGAVTFVGAADAARIEYTKKGTAYMNAWMYAIREFEDAIDDCSAGDLTSNALSSGPVHAWDEGVGFYVGSMMKYDDMLAGNLPTLDGKGKLAYTLGNKRCKNFKTCGPDGDALLGEAKANIDLWQLFSMGQYQLLAGKCAEVVPVKDEIVKKMSVPLVQGTLRYAYKVAHLSGKDKEKAEGGIFAAAILPQVHACDPAAAKIVYDNMNLASSATDFMAVKGAFEGCYEKMGITCKDVGGLWNSATSKYYADGGSSAAPCVDPSPLPQVGLIAIIVAIAVFVLCCLAMLVIVKREKDGKPIFTSLKANA